MTYLLAACVRSLKSPFLPMAVNVASKDATPEWYTLRVYASESELANLREHVAAGAGNELMCSSSDSL